MRRRIIRKNKTNRRRINTDNLMILLTAVALLLFITILIIMVFAGSDLEIDQHDSEEISYISETTASEHICDTPEKIEGISETIIANIVPANIIDVSGIIVAEIEPNDAIDSVETIETIEIVEPIDIIEKIQTPLYYDIPLSHELQDFTREICESYGCPLDLVLAVMSVESDYRNIISTSGRDFGLMQINRVNHKWLADEYGFDNMLDPKQNITAGVIMLAGYLDEYCGYNEALMLYNNGPTGAKRKWKQGIYETVYTRRVMERLEGLEFVG